MPKVIFKDFIILIIVSLIFVFTFPLFAKQINEKQFPAESYARIITGLPSNETIIWTENLPENEDKIRPKKIRINLSDQKMYLYEGKEVIDEFVVSSGKPGYETPIGEFQIRNKFDRAWSKNYGLWMPYWMAFLPSGYMGIHELPEWPNGYKEGADHLGQAVSHGCIRLGVGPAKEVYEWTEVGTFVEIIR